MKGKDPVDLCISMNSFTDMPGIFGVPGRWNLQSPPIDSLDK